MSFGIIIKNSSKRFQPHFNRELTDRANPGGKMIWTKDDYTSEMKRKGLEHYDPKSVKPVERKKYTPSKEARAIVSAIESRKNKDGTVDVPTKVIDFIRQNSGYKKSRKINL